MVDFRDWQTLEAEDARWESADLFESQVLGSGFKSRDCAQYRPQNVIIHTIGTPKRVCLISGVRLSDRVPGIWD